MQILMVSNAFTKVSKIAVRLSSGIRAILCIEIMPALGIVSFLFANIGTEFHD